MENDYIRGLIDRFLQAETTIEEEEKLYRFFQSDIMPDDLKQYKEMFMAYSGMRVEDSQLKNREKEKKAVSSIRFGNKENSQKGTGKRILNLYSKIGLGIAASLLIGVIGFSAYRHYEMQRLENLYGGSYVIINGNRIDDLAKIKPQIIDGIHKAAAMEKLCDSKAKQDEIESRFINNVSDEKEKKYIKDLLCD